MAAITLNINGENRTFDVDDQMPLLWVIRDFAGLKGTKFGCGIGACGSCTVLMDGDAVHACTVAVGAIGKAKITTIEGISEKNEHPVQQAWIDEQVPQCGYCQSGQIMAAIALLHQNSNPSSDDIDTAMSRVICRCGTYPRIKKAINGAIETINKNM